MTRYRSFAPSTGTFVVVPEENEKSEPFSNRKQVRIFLVWWARVDSNHRSWKAADLQSVPIGHSGTRPDSISTATADCLYILPSRLDFVNRFLKKISIKVQLFRKTLRLCGFCFLLAAPFLWSYAVFLHVCALSSRPLQICRTFRAFHNAYKSKNPTIHAVILTVYRRIFLGAGDRSWTCNPLITNQLRCHCATPAKVT